MNWREHAFLGGVVALAAIVGVALGNGLIRIVAAALV